MPTSTPMLSRRSRQAVAALVPCDERTVAAYYNPDRKISTVAEHHVRRTLILLGLPDPRATVPEPAYSPTTLAERGRLFAEYGARHGLDKAAT